MRGRSLHAAGALVALLSGLAGCAGRPGVVSADADVGAVVRPVLVAPPDAIDCIVDRGHATLVVRLTVHNEGTTFQRFDRVLRDLPEGAVATGLRALAGRNGRAVWFAGALMETAAAARAYEDLSGVGGDAPRGRTLLSWRDDMPALEIFPIDPGASKTVEYTLEAPMPYRDGRHVLTLPRGTDGFRPRVTFVAAHGGDTLAVGDHEVASGEPLQLPDDGLTLTLARPAEDRPRLDGAFAAVPFAPGRALLHTALDVAPRLSEAPRAPWVVIALDGSRSMSDAQRGAEITAARAYLDALPDAQVTVLTFARSTKARTAGFVSTGDARTALGSLGAAGGAAWKGENGSALDAALLEASARLDASAPDGAVRRIVALTDLRTRAALLPATITAVSLASHAVVHLASIDAGDAALRRDDDDPWAAPARATGGVLWRAAAPLVDADPPRTRLVYEEWARPLRIDRIAVTGAGLGADALGVPPSMNEGQGFEDLRIVTSAPSDLTIEGELWSTPIATHLVPDDAGNRLWSALVFGDERVRKELSAPEMTTLATRGHAVSPVTSLLAIEPGARPAVDTDLAGFGLMGIGTSCGCGGSHCGIRIRHVTRSRSFDPVAWLRRSLAGSLARCGAADRSATLRIETTSTEIVDAHVATLTGSADAAVERCVEDAAWALELPADFSSPRAAYDVELPAAGAP